MKRCLLSSFFLFLSLKGICQVELHIHQPKCKTKTYVSLANQPDIKAQYIDSETQVFTIPLPKEPKLYFFMVDSIGFQLERFWVEPNTKKIDFNLYNCKGYHFSVDKPNQLTIEERAKHHYIMYLTEKYYDKEIYIKEYKKYSENYIRENPASYLSLYLIANNNFDSNTKLELLQLVAPANSEYSLFKKTERSIKYKYSPKLGDTIKAITANNINGKPFKIENLDKKPTVFVFWMAGCKWSTKLLPQIAEMSKKYQNANFVYYSLDESKALWEQTSIEKQIPAENNISELDGYLGITPLSLGVSATPCV